MSSADPRARTLEEPPTGSVVAIDWGGSRQEVWVSSRSNIGNWYTTDIPLAGDRHPTWYDVLRRAEGRTLTILIPAGETGYAAGFTAGVTEVSGRIQQAVEDTVDELLVRHVPGEDRCRRCLRPIARCRVHHAPVKLASDPDVYCKGWHHPDGHGMETHRCDTPYDRHGNVAEPAGNSLTDAAGDHDRSPGG